MRPGFLVDAMLGRAAEWLRILGYDVIFVDNTMDDSAVLKLLEGDRTLLTRDRQLVGRAVSSGKNAIFLSSDSIDGQMAQLVSSLEIDADRLFTRCPHCGFILERVSKEDAGKSGMVPEGSLEGSEEFWRCPHCGKYYWKGSHWPKIIDRLREWGIEVDERLI